MSLYGNFDLHELPVSSEILQGNPLGDPHERKLFVLAPRGHEPTESVPAVWMLAGYGSSQGGFLANDPWKEGLAQRVTKLMDSGAMPPSLLVLPDLFTRFGGSQFIDSDATGRYGAHLWEELAPELERRFAVKGHALAGHSSGGYGAIVHAMRYPGKARAIACHAGDMFFEMGYAPDFPKAAAQIRRAGGVEKLLAAHDAALNKYDGRFLSAMNAVAMAACYSPDANEPMGVALPFDLDTCELIEPIWARWLENDPVRMVDVEGLRQGLADLRCLFIDAGSRDEWNLHLGARVLTRKLKGYGVPHVYEEFDGGHMGTSYRFERSLPMLVEAIVGE